MRIQISKQCRLNIVHYQWRREDNILDSDIFNYNLFIHLFRLFKSILLSKYQRFLHMNG